MDIFSMENARPASILRAGNDVLHHSRQIISGAGRARTLSDWEHAWTGIASSAANHRVQASINPIDVLGITAQGVAGVFLAHGQLLELVCRIVRGTTAAARTAGMIIAPDGTVSPGPAGAVPGVNVWAVSASRALSAVLRGALSIARVSDAAAAGAVHSATTGMKEPPKMGGGGWSGASELKEVPVDEQQNPFGTVRTYGRIGNAEEVITLVSGVGSSGEDSRAKTDLWARQKVTEAAAAGKQVAVVAWHGYPAPDSVAEAVSPSAAKAAAGDLREFQRELRQHAPNARLHVVGYSYGSTVVGLAGKTTDKGVRHSPASPASPPGLEADRISLWGSPGAGVGDAGDIAMLNHGTPNAGAWGSDTPNEAGQVTVERAPGDLIGLVTTPLGGPLGRDPASPMFHEGFDQKASATGWGEYLWRNLTDMYLWSRGETDSHSSYLWDPGMNPTTNPGTNPR
ncbi:alpha/beta hydrolase [Corynebacterium auriscanis]